MNRKLFFLTLIALAACPAANAQSPTNADWVGVWHANADGLPTDTLTLATDTGELGGTVVLDMVTDEGGTPHVIASEPHVLMNPRVDGGTLGFQVKMKKPDGSVVVARFVVTHTSPGKADIHCTSCGPSAPMVELIRGQ